MFKVVLCDFDSPTNTFLEEYFKIWEANQAAAFSFLTTTQWVHNILYHQW